MTDFSAPDGSSVGAETEAGRAPTLARPATSGWQRRDFSADELESIRLQRQQGVPWYRIALGLNCAACTVRCAVDEKYRLKRRARTNEMRAQRPRKSRSGTRAPAYHRVTSSEACSEQRNPIYDPRRDGYLPAPETLTSVMMGDPPPGWHEIQRRLG